VVNFTGLGSPGELVEVEISAASSQTLSGQESILARARS
jgi:tRNA-2-methylthio-N6-dimethylallyladenosine synthase